MEAGVRSGWGSDPIQEVLDQILACSGLTLAQLSGTCPEFEMAVTSEDVSGPLCGTQVLWAAESDVPVFQECGSALWGEWCLALRG